MEITTSSNIQPINFEQSSKRMEASLSQVGQNIKTKGNTSVGLLQAIDQSSSVKQFNEQEKQQLEEEVNKLFNGKVSLNYSWSELTNSPIVKFVDNQTKEVVKQIPSEQILKMLEGLRESQDKKGFLLSIKI